MHQRVPRLLGPPQRREPREQRIRRHLVRGLGLGVVLQGVGGLRGFLRLVPLFGPVVDVFGCCRCIGCVGRRCDNGRGSSIELVRLRGRRLRGGRRLIGLLLVGRRLLVLARLVLLVVVRGIIVVVVVLGRTGWWSTQPVLPHQDGGLGRRRRRPVVVVVVEAARFEGQLVIEAAHAAAEGGEPLVEGAAMERAHREDAARPAGRVERVVELEVERVVLGARLERVGVAAAEADLARCDDARLGSQADDAARSFCIPSMRARRGVLVVVVGGVPTDVVRERARVDVELEAPLGPVAPAARGNAAQRGGLLLREDAAARAALLEQRASDAERRALVRPHRRRVRRVGRGRRDDLGCCKIGWSMGTAAFKVCEFRGLGNMKELTRSSAAAQASSAGMASVSAARGARR
mmetsp:Transcript_24477/g.97108  ORF Transcript_24477/g.97108 Transcript_24477/m.97108 type:complete len:406 (+) Transcript_24477:974-2191(+)